MNTRLLELEKDVLHVKFLRDNRTYKTIDLKTGYKFLTEIFFKKDYPTEIETEYAINHIEDELMKDKSLVNVNEKLIFTNEKFINILRQNGYNKTIHSRTDIEELFNKYALIVLGDPISRTGIEITREDFAILLLMREIMHHLKFEEINLSNTL